MSKPLIILLFGTLLLILHSCHADNTPTPGIYYWQSEWTLDSAAVASIKSTRLTSLYIRLFDIDVDLNGRTYPRGPIQLTPETQLPEDLRIVPVIYIVNEVFRQPTEPEQLVSDLLEGINNVAGEHGAIINTPRLQIDCDWTPQTRDAYFAFLTALKLRLPRAELSVTVRLHQYRERSENGVPPADRGLLMCYNFAPVQDRKTSNAIFDAALLTGYLKSAGQYPLPLDAALPLFSWGAAFRDDRFLGIVCLPVADDRLRAFADNRFLVQSDTTSGDLLLRAGDEVRADGPGDYGGLKNAIAALRQSGDIEQVLFFDWRPKRLEQYRVNELITEFYQ